MTDSIVVGFDNTEHSFRAVDCAIREARARKTPLRLVNVYQWIPPTSFGLPPGLAAEEAMHGASTAVAAEAAERVRSENPDLVVESASVSGDPAGALADASRSAAMLVVGGRGRGGFVGQLLGSVALRVLGYAECPVMVVRGDPAQDTGRVMVGVDLEDPQGSSDILEFAFSEAVLRGADVYLIHVWDDPARFYVAGGAYLPEMFTAISANRRKALESLLEPWKQKYPDVMVSCQAFPGSPSRRLVDSTRLVDALVIGGRARTEGHAGMRVGALAHTVLHHAHCPVIVVPEH